MALGKCKHGTWYKGKWDNEVNVFVLPQTHNVLCLGPGPDLLRCVFNVGKLLLSFREGTLIVLVAFTKPIGFTLKTLKSLFTDERCEILAALKSATPWRETSECTVFVDTTLCYESTMRHLDNY